MNPVLVFGGSGVIGAPLIERLLAGGAQVLAVSRQAAAMPPRARLTWLPGWLQSMPVLPARPAMIASCGPLDAFAEWFAGSDLDPARVVAFGSTSVHVKHDSPDAAERELAARLAAAEARLAAACRERGSGLDLLRPTLIYGRGGDRSLARIVALARRHGRFVLPSDANGLRQPVHAEDLAAAAIAALQDEAGGVRAYDLPGGETLGYAQMVQRTLAVLDPSPRLHRVPPALFALLVALVRRSGRLEGFSPAMQARLCQDLVFDAEPARRELGYAPRPFRPEAAQFESVSS
ncbi:NAD-dependent epimerase/dehydratase family protein [Luteimonas sp. e5]